MMNYKNDSSLRSIYLGYSHKTLRYTDCKAPSNAQGRNKSACGPSRAQAASRYAGRAIYADASLATRKKLVM